MKQHENELQRFMQTRDEFHSEIKKIEPCITSLQDTANRVTSQFEILGTISQSAQDHIKAAIKAASSEMAQVATQQFYAKIEDKIQSEITNLNQSVQNARKVLETVERRNKVKNMLITILGVLVIAMGSFGGGYFYNKKTTYSLSNEILETYGYGVQFRKVWSKLNAKEKLKIEKLTSEK